MLLEPCSNVAKICRLCWSFQELVENLHTLGSVLGCFYYIHENVRVPSEARPWIGVERGRKQ